MGHLSESRPAPTKTVRTLNESLKVSKQFQNWFQTGFHSFSFISMCGQFTLQTKPVGQTFTRYDNES